MSYQSLYRKYRSQNFSELVGQSHVAVTLSQAVKRQQIAHAYLFSGPRGTGKTSSARILAKLLNCQATRDQVECSDQNCVCHKITASQSLDVIEIDAASHTGVDNIRALNDQVQLVPVESNYKVIIVDEVHMLSTGAFNALLKTLEEPPQKVVFVLATTEFHKIPVTIRSRCQHFQFKLLSNAEIADHLLQIAEKENIPLQSAAAAYIARYSRGCMRDALSLLDQANVARSSDLDVALLCEISGSVDIEDVATLIQTFLNNKSAELIKHLIRFDQQGINVFQLCQDLVSLIQEMMACKCGEDSPSLTPELKALAQSAQWNAMLVLFEAVSGIVLDLKWHPYPLTLLQLNLLKALSDEPVSEKKSSIQNSQQFIKAEEKVQISKIAPQAKKEPIEALPKANTAVQQEKPASLKKIDVQDPAAVEKQWDAFLEYLKNGHKALFALLRSSKFAGVDQGSWVIELSDSYQFFLEKLQEAKTIQLLKEQAKCLGFELPPLKVSLSNLPADQRSHSEDTADGTDLVDNSHSQQENTTEAVAGLTLNEIVKLFEGTLISG